MNLLELAAQVDPATLLVLLGFWARWEAWRLVHDTHHRRLDVALTLRTDP